MAAIYTDASGQGYDLNQLRQAYSSGTFANDPLASRVPDILAQYGSAPASATPSMKLPNEYPGADPSQLGITGATKVQPVPSLGAPPPLGAMPPGTASTGAKGVTGDQLNQWYKQYLGRDISTDPTQGAIAWNSWANMDPASAEAAIKNSPEALAYTKSQSGQTPPPASGATPNPNDPNYSLLMNTVLSRLKQLSTPVDTTAQNAFITQALSRVQQLSGAPFTDAQSAALLTQHMAPLTQARDAAKQQAAEQMSRRGISPSSGLFIDTMNKIDQSYQKGVAGVTNTLNVKGIDQATQNANTQLALLNSIVEMNRATQNQQEGLSSQLVPTAGVMSSLDSNRLGLANQTASLDNPNTAISQLLALGQLGLNNQGQVNSQNAAQSAAMAQLIYALMNGKAGLFG